MKRQLLDMVVVITGASAGIGKALAEKLNENGAKLLLSARREDRLAELNRALGSNHLVVRADVARPEDCERLITAAKEHFGRIDTLVCNAGYGIARALADMSHDEMAKLFATNVFGTTDCIRAAVPIMIKQEPRDGWRGQIMIVSSAAARRGLPFFSAYSATKAAQLNLAEGLRVELRDDAIAVTTVLPVGTETDFFTIAQEHGRMKMPPPGAGERRQSAATVARKMVAAIARPRPELWPMLPARYGLIASALVPGLTDRVMSRYRGDFQPTDGT